MAVTLEQIAGYLSEMGMEFDYDRENEVITSGAGDGSNAGAIFIRTKENGDIFTLQLEPLDDNHDSLDPASTHEHIGVLLPQLLYFNYNTKFGTWEYDPSDGDLRFSVEIPLEDALMTEKQFQRIISMLGTSLDHIGKIKHILKTGEAPENDISGGMAELMEQFGEFLKEQQQGGKKGGDSEGI